MSGAALNYRVRIVFPSLPVSIPERLRLCQILRERLETYDAKVKPRSYGDDLCDIEVVMHARPSRVDAGALAAITAITTELERRLGNWAPDRMRITAEPSTGSEKR